MSLYPSMEVTFIVLIPVVSAELTLIIHESEHFRHNAGRCQHVIA